MTVEYN